MEKIDLSQLFESQRSGEAEVKKMLRAAAYIVEDVSDNPLYWKKDIDLLVTNPVTGNTAAIEVKNDTRMNKTGNFFIEYANPRSRGGLGWFEFCEADYLYYVDSVSETCYIISLKALKEFINQNKSNLKKRETADCSKGYIVPIEEMPLYRVISLQEERINEVCELARLNRLH